MQTKRPLSVIWEKAPDIKKRVLRLIKILNLTWIEKDNIYCFRSKNSSSKAYARIWGLSRIWQIAINAKPSYIIEVLSQKFDKLSSKKQDEILIHELVHIPKNFSGSLLPHINRRGKKIFYHKVNELFSQYQKKVRY